MARFTISFGFISVALGLALGLSSSAHAAWCKEVSLNQYAVDAPGTTLEMDLVGTLTNDGNVGLGIPWSLVDIPDPPHANDTTVNLLSIACSFTANSPNGFCWDPYALPSQPNSPRGGYVENLAADDTVTMTWRLEITVPGNKARRPRVFELSCPPQGLPPSTSKGGIVLVPSGETTTKEGWADPALTACTDCLLAQGGDELNCPPCWETAYRFKGHLPPDPTLVRFDKHFMSCPATTNCPIKEEEVASVPPDGCNNFSGSCFPDAALAGHGWNVWNNTFEADYDYIGFHKFRIAYIQDDMGNMDPLTRTRIAAGSCVKHPPLTPSCTWVTTQEMKLRIKDSESDPGIHPAALRVKSN